MNKASIGWKGDGASILEVYDATKLLNTPFKVLLKESVKQILDDDGQVAEIFVPDPDGLLRAVAQYRVLHSQKLSGPDLKFLRKALDIKAKDFAVAVELSAEHLSRVEAGEKVLSPSSEKLVRIFTTYMFSYPLAKGDIDAKKFTDKVSSVFNRLSIKSCYDSSQELTLVFEHVPCIVENPNADDGTWSETSELIAA
jgi:transcriptional regulator with XRE-family HTH domain